MAAQFGFCPATKIRHDVSTYNIFIFFLICLLIFLEDVDIELNSWPGPCQVLLSGHLCPSCVLMLLWQAWEQRRAVVRCVGFLSLLPGQTRPMTLHVWETSFTHARCVCLGELACTLGILTAPLPSRAFRNSKCGFVLLGLLTCCLDNLINPACKSALCFPS